MRVVLVSCVFPPEHGSSAQMGAQTAEELSRRGHSVHVYAPFPSHPKGRLFDGYKRTVYSTSTANSEYTLIRCFGTFSRSSTMMSRFVENLSFGITSGLRILFGKRPDVIYSNSWPIFATGIVAIIAKLRGVPLVLRVQDVYPESLESQRRVTTRGWAFRLLRQCDLMIARSSQKLLVISPVFQQLYENDRGVSAGKVYVFPNWANDNLADADSSVALDFRRKLGIPEDAFLVVYAGNVGVASNAEVLVDALAKLRDLPRIYLVIAGDGSQIGICRDEAERQHLDRVVIHTPWKPEETGPVLQMADVLLLPTRGKQSLNSIPSKLITYLLSGRPVIAAVLPESDTATAILGSGAGWVIHPDSADLMAKTIAAASEQSAESLSQIGSVGRKYALQNLTLEANLPRVIHILEQAAKLQNRGVREPTGSNFVSIGEENRSGADSGSYVACAQLSHLDSIVQIHLAAFKGFFLESMGARFLKVLYRGFLVESTGVCLVAIEGKDVVGFVVGTTQPEGFFRRLLRRQWPAFVFAGTASLTLHPLRVGKKFLSALSYRGEKPVDVPNATLLSSIGVAPSGKGKGVGNTLISAFCERAQASGAPTVFLTTDRDGNDAVNQFYLLNGFKLHRSFLKERGRWMNLYTRSLLDA